jgi:hypothetical protein
MTVGKDVQLIDVDYAQDITLAEDDPLKAQILLNKVPYRSAMVGLGIDLTKTKLMSANSWRIGRYPTNDNSTH